MLYVFIYALLSSKVIHCNVYFKYTFVYVYSWVHFYFCLFIYSLPFLLDMDFFEVGWGINFEPAWASVALGLGTFNPNAKYTALFKIDVTFLIMLKKYNREKRKHETTLAFSINEER